MHLADNTEESPETADQADLQFHPQGVIHHTYTTIQSEMATAPHNLTNLEEWSSTFPSFEAHSIGVKDVPVFLFEAGINLKNKHVHSSRIEILFGLDFVNGSRYRDWFTQTQIKDRQGLSDVQVDNMIHVYATATDNETTRLDRLSLMAHRWAELFRSFLEDGQAAEHSGSANNLLERAEEDSANVLRKVKCMQQLWATPDSANAQARCMAVLLWKFHKVGRAEEGTTSWRRLLFPRNNLQGQNRAISSVPLTLPSNASVLTEGRSRPNVLSNLVDGQVGSEGGALASNKQYTGALPAPPVAPEGSSPGSGYQTDVGSSLASPVSASFPTSLSGSSSLAQLSQQNSFVSQNSVDLYPPYNAAGTQSSAWTFDSHEQDSLSYDLTATYPDEQHYDQGDAHGHSLQQYQRLCEGYQEFTSREFYGISQQSNAETTVNSQKDFTGGSIQISFDELPADLGIACENNDFVAAAGSQEPEYPVGHEHELLLSEHDDLANARLDMLQREHLENLQRGLVSMPLKLEKGTPHGTVSETSADDDQETQMQLLSSWPRSEQTPDRETLVQQGESRLKTEDDEGQVVEGPQQPVSSFMPHGSQQEPLQSTDTQQAETNHQPQADQQRNMQLISYPSPRKDTSPLHAAGGHITEYASPYESILAPDSPLFENVDEWQHVEDFVCDVADSLEQ